MSASDTLAEFLPPYIAEVEELLAGARASLLAAEPSLQQGGANPRLVRELFRTVHTIKGLSAMVEVEPVVAIAHQMETSLRGADHASGRFSEDGLERTFQGLAAIEQRIRALASGKPVAPAPAELLASLEGLAGNAVVGKSDAPEADIALDPAVRAKLSASEWKELTDGVAHGRRAVLVRFAPSPQRAQAGVNINTVRERLAKSADLVKVLPVSAATSPESPGGLYFLLLLLTHEDDAALVAASGVDAADVQQIARAAPVPAYSAFSPTLVELDDGAHRAGVVRVESDRLDDAMERVGALVVSRSRLLRSVAAMTEAGVDTRDLQQVLAENGRLLRDMRASLLRIRMVRVAEVLERLPLLVRGLRQTTGKAVQLKLALGGAEIDKAVGDRLLPAIIHLVRNAVDHGIESAAERARLGKPPDGAIHITCHERASNKLEIVVQDDGRGVDAAALARKAGVTAPDSADGLLDLLARPGLSSKDTVTTTSGRGMGVDIVKRIVVDQLGGELKLATTASQGTTFTLSVPLTISIVDAFIFAVGDQRYAAPVAAVDELVDVDSTQVIHGPAGGRSRGIGLIQRRGQAIPLLALEGLFTGRGGAVGVKAIIVQHKGEPVAFAVDRMLAQQEIVIRPLEDPLVLVRGVTGATDLGDGQPTLVLDLAALSTTGDMERAA